MNANAIDVATKHFKGLGQKSFKVPAWDGMEIFCKPVTFEKIDEINRLQDSDTKEEFNVCALIILALNKDGSQMFKKIDRPELLAEVSSYVIGTVVIQLTMITGFKKAKKNS